MGNRVTTPKAPLVDLGRSVRTDLQIMTDQRGRAFGFVNFEQPNDAKESLG